MRILFVSLFQFFLLHYAFAQGTEKPLTEVTTIDGLKYLGTILHPDDSLFIFWQSREPFSLERIDEFALFFHIYEIERIVIRRKGGFGSGIKQGAIVGGIASIPILIIPSDEPFAGAVKVLAIGIIVPTWTIIIGITGAMRGNDYEFITQGSREFYQKILPKLQKNAMFTKSLPPAMQPYVERQRKTFPSHVPARSTISKSRKPPFTPLLTK